MKHRFVLDTLEDGSWRIDIKVGPKNGKTIGHIMLSDSGLSWKFRRNKSAEIPWNKVETTIKGK